MSRTYEVVIVGAGPAGCSTALALAHLAPDLLQDLVVLEKARHPRPKPCGGGITIIGERILRQLRLSWEDLHVPHVPIREMRLRYDGEEFYWRVPGIFRVVDRPTFDAALVARVRQAGIRVQEETPVTAVEREGNTWRLTTPRGNIRARIVIGADGANSVVRQALPAATRARRVSRIVEVHTPAIDPVGREVHRDHLAVFDFTVMRAGAQGYVWDFPFLRDGEMWVNRGVFDSRVWSGRPRANLRDLIAQSLRARGLALQDFRLVGHPERWYHPRDVYSAPGLILVGDAAGVEPLLGEGISMALWYGVTVAPWIVEALARGDLSFADYETRLAQSDLGRHLTLRLRLAQFSYARSDRFVRFWWRWLGRFLALYGLRVRRQMQKEGLGQIN